MLLNNSLFFFDLVFNIMPSKKRKLHSTNTTGYTGVSKSGERFVAQIAVNKKKTYLHFRVEGGDGGGSGGS